MPVAVATVIQLAARGRVKNGYVAWIDFEPAFAEIIARHDGAKSKEAWRPFYHLSRGVGLWDLRKGSSPADFSDLPKKKPSSAAALRSRADHAQLNRELAESLERPEVRAALEKRIESLLAEG